MQHQAKSNFTKSRPAEGRGTFIGTVRLMLPYIWPTDRADLKLRVILAIVLMFLSKFVTIAIPYSFKWATDAIAGGGSVPDVGPVQAVLGVVGLTALYGGLRMLMSLTQQSRDALFASVAPLVQTRSSGWQPSSAARFSRASARAMAALAPA